MDSRSRFSALEAMCRDRAALAEKEMNYWLSEANEWKHLKEASGTFAPTAPVQLDWCVPYSAQVVGAGELPVRGDYLISR